MEFDKGGVAAQDLRQIWAMAVEPHDHVPATSNVDSPNTGIHRSGLSEGEFKYKTQEIPIVQRKADVAQDREHGQLALAASYSSASLGLSSPLTRRSIRPSR